MIDAQEKVAAEGTLAPRTVLEKILVLAGIFGLFGLAASQVKSFDIFWQLQSGRYMVQTRAFIHHDIFSLAPSAPRFEHCWLHDLVFYGVYLLGGFRGISILKGLLVTATGVAAVATARRRDACWPVILPVTLPLLLLTWGGWLERPQLWSFLFFTTVLLVLESYRRQPGRFLWLLPPLLALWANFHAGAVLAVPVMIAYLVGEGGARLFSSSSLSAQNYRRLAWVALALLPALLATPYAWQMLQTLIHAAGYGVGSGIKGQVFNMDWRATSFANSPTFYYALGVALLLVGAGWRRFSLTDGLLLAGLAFMGLRLERHTTFFLVAAAAFLPRYADVLWEGVRVRLPGRRVWLLRLAGLVLAGALFYQQVPSIYQRGGFFRTGLLVWHYPVAAARFVRDQKLPANLYNTYDWGGYLMWTLYPEYKVFWDGRSDSPRMFGLGLQVMRAHAQWPQILERFRVNTVVTKACTMDTGQHYPIIDALQQSPHWALVFADQSALIFVRRRAVPTKWLAAHQLPASRIDDTILSEAQLLLAANAWRYMAWYEIARIEMDRGHDRVALQALTYYMRTTPKPDPMIVQYYSKLLRRFGRR